MKSVYLVLLFIQLLHFTFTAKEKAATKNQDIVLPATASSVKKIIYIYKLITQLNIVSMCFIFPCLLHP